MKHYYLILEHRSAESDLRLRSENESLRRQLEGLRKRLAEVTNLYGAEVQYNNALCDLLRSNGISFRHVFSHDFRFRQKGSGA